jgi:hypothetical protein
MTVAIHSYREKEEKAVDVVVATTIYPYIFFFSLISCFFFLPYYYTKPKKEPLYEHILFSSFFFAHWPI